MARFRQTCLLPLALTLATACSLPRWPVAGPMTSAWGLRLDGLWPEIHRGVDVGVDTGTPVHAMDDGQVEFAGSMRGYGNTVILRHGVSTRSLYAHLSEFRVRTGDSVSHAQVIALSGATGDVSGPHLHFEILRNGRSEDAVLLLGGWPPRK